MKSLSSAAAIATLLAVTVSAQAQQRPYPEGRAAAAEPKAVGGALKIIYRVSGVTDNGGPSNIGVATSFLCTNGSAVVETVRISVRNLDGAAAGPHQTITIAPNTTWTMATHGTNIFYEDKLLAPGIVINQGSAVIQATNSKVFCSAMIIDAAATVPQGIALHMVRFDPALGSQE